MPRLSYKSKNRFCKNANLTENQFLLVLWSYACLMTPSVAEARIKTRVPEILYDDPEFKPVTRVTLSRYHLLLGDHYFCKSHHIEHPLWPMRMCALWRSLFRIHESGFGLDELINTYYHSAEFNADYSALKAYFKPRKGVKLDRFTSHIGTYEKLKSMILEYYQQENSDQVLFEYCYWKLREEFEENPLDPKAVISHRLKFDGFTLGISALKNNEEVDPVWQYRLPDLVRWGLNNGFSEQYILDELSSNYNSRSDILQEIERFRAE